MGTLGRGLVSRCTGLRDQRVLGRAWSVRKQCWDSGVCDKGELGWGHSGSGWRAGSGVLVLGGSPFPSSVLITQALDGV